MSKKKLVIVTILCSLIILNMEAYTPKPCLYNRLVANVALLACILTVLLEWRPRYSHDWKWHKHAISLLIVLDAAGPNVCVFKGVPSLFGLICSDIGMFIALMMIYTNWGEADQH